MDEAAEQEKFKAVLTKVQPLLASPGELRCAFRNQMNDVVSFLLLVVIIVVGADDARFLKGLGVLAQCVEAGLVAGSPNIPAYFAAFEAAQAVPDRLASKITGQSSFFFFSLLLFNAKSI